METVLMVLVVLELVLMVLVALPVLALLLFGLHQKFKRKQTKMPQLVKKRKKLLTKLIMTCLLSKTDLINSNNKQMILSESTKIMPMRCLVKLAVWTKKLPQLKQTIQLKPKLHPLNRDLQRLLIVFLMILLANTQSWITT